MAFKPGSTQADAAYFRPFCRTEIPPPKLDSKEKEEKLLKIMEPFILNDEDVGKMKEALHQELDKGLEKGDTGSSLAMQRTYMEDLPDGSENGMFLGMDLGGTRFRLIMVQMENGKEVDSRIRYFHAPETVRLGTGEQLFNFLAGCVEEFVKRERLDTSKTLPLGFCFSFAVEQESLQSAKLKAWSKNFDAQGVIGEDVVKMMNSALKKRDVNVFVNSILNNTTGTLVSAAVEDRDSAIGLNIGQGCNACYVQNVDSAPKLKGEVKGNEEIINIEWGAFGDNGVVDFLKTDFDKEVDQNGVRPGQYTFEKLMSGDYIGELVRLILHKMAEEGPFFGKFVTTRLGQYGALNSKHVAKVEEGTIEGGTKKIKEVLDHLDLLFDRDDMRAMQYICAVVSARAAELVAICITCLLERMNRSVVTIAVAGSLYKLHPRLRDLLQFYTDKHSKKHKFKYLFVADGSGKGAAFVAAVAEHKKSSS